MNENTSIIKEHASNEKLAVHLFITYTKAIQISNHKNKYTKIKSSL